MTTAAQRPVAAIVLAAGKGTRLKSDLPKVLHPLFGKPLLFHVLDTLTQTRTRPGQVFVVVGHGRDMVLDTLTTYKAPFDLQTAVQEPQHGTGHAVQEVLRQQPEWADWDGDMLVLSGDTPLLEPASLQQLIADHQTGKHDLTVLTATLDNPFGYGRVIINNNQVCRIVEQKDATDDEKAVQTINTSIYCINWPTVSPLLAKLSNNNAQGEFYLTDVVALAVEAGLSVGVSTLADVSESLGINSRADLALCHQKLNQRTIRRLMDAGVSILSPETTFVSPEVTIGADTTLLPGCTLQGDITIGKRCVIGPHTTMNGTVNLGDDVKVTHSVIRDSRIGAFSSVGPFAQLRDGVDLSHHVHIGNFVEIKKSQIDHHTNAGHLSYIGDAVLGTDVNIGAGTITANFDPIKETKSQTIVKDGVKVGSNTVLVAPVTLNQDASVAAGSVITRDVDAGDLAIARERQTAVKGWVYKTKKAQTSNV